MPIANFEKTTAKYLIIASDGNWMLQDLDRNHYPVIRLPINTRAAAMGGFTPISRGVPVFYTTWGDQGLDDNEAAGGHPQPFRESDNLPSSDNYNPTLAPSGEVR